MSIKFFNREKLCADAFSGSDVETWFYTVLILLRRVYCDTLDILDIYSQLYDFVVHKIFL